MEIRKIKATEYHMVYDLIKTAFATAEVSNGAEQDFVNSLRESNRHLPELEFVCYEKGELIGHIMFTLQQYKTEEGKELAGLLLAPLCVKKEYRNIGVGSKLVRYGISEAKRLGYKAAFLVGNPDYYTRFGFKETGAYKIKNVSEIPNKFVLAYEIEAGALTEAAMGEVSIA